MRSRPPKRSRVATPQEEGANYRQIIIFAAIGLGVVALIGLLFITLNGPADILGLERIVGLSRSHDPNVVYENVDQLPPVGGVHDPVWQNCGIYDTEVEAKHVLHSLEHGAVWVTYSPELSEDEVTTLQETVRDETFVVLSPYPGLRSPVVLTAWGIQLEVDSVDDSRIAAFIDRYQKGPQTPELQAGCTDGTGSPISVGQ